jgi:hypothetical protein
MADSFITMQKPILVPFITRHILKILHIRRSGSELAKRPSLNTWKWERDSKDIGIVVDILRRTNTADQNVLEDDTSDDNMYPDNISERNLSDADASADRPVFEVNDTADSDPSSTKLEALFSFANWAFGPEGFPVLDILAFGDFSYQGRFSKYNLLLCRDKSSSSPANPHSARKGTALTFRKVRKNDRALWDLLKRNSDFLEACPTDPILYD